MDGRKATMYIPLLVCIIACLVDSYYTKFQSLSYLLIVLFTVHFIYCIRPLSTREWWFDAHNQEVMSFIDTHPVDGQKSITTSWHFGSAMNYYNRFTFNNRITTMSNFREASVNLSPTYFYVLDEDISKIPSGYKLVKKYSIGSYLYTR
jgi:hypothetical protein